MKVRKGFVSNSSSSSFVICKKNLTKEQIRKIQKWLEESNDITDSKYSDKNNMNESKEHFFGRMSMHVKWVDFLKEIFVSFDQGD
jgi:hypothetical protein